MAVLWCMDRLYSDVMVAKGQEKTQHGWDV